MYAATVRTCKCANTHMLILVLVLASSPGSSCLEQDRLLRQRSCPLLLPGTFVRENEEVTVDI